MIQHLEGIITALLTGIDEKDQLNEESTRKLARRAIDSGVHGLFILGTNGEFHALSEEEKERVATIIIEEANHQIPVIVGVGGNSTVEVQRRSKRMEDLGADYLSVITPFFEPPSQEELYDYFKDIAASVNIPIMIYNMPSRSGVSVSPDTVTALSKIENIIGIKDSSGDIDQVKAYIDATKDFDVFAGADSLILQTLQHGGSGGVAATSNMFPRLTVDIYTNWKNNDEQEAEALQKALQPIRNLSKIATTPAVFKETVNQLGINIGEPRKPVRGLNQEQKQQVTEILKEYKVYL